MLSNRSVYMTCRSLVARSRTRTTILRRLPADLAHPYHEDIIPMKFPHSILKTDSLSIPFQYIENSGTNRLFLLVIAIFIALFGFVACGSDPVVSSPTSTIAPTAAEPTATAVRITVTVPPVTPTPDPATATPDPTDGLGDSKNLSVRPDDRGDEITEDEEALLAAFEVHWNAAKSGDWEAFLDGCKAGARGDKTAVVTAEKFVAALGWWVVTPEGFDIIEGVATVLSPSTAYVEGYIAENGQATGTSKGAVVAWLWTTENGKWLDSVCALSR